ncbi:serine/threonine-protein kinase [Aliikangiella sp. G2MR2-5]|uniref:serine/threonine-protein kinase n=1 Tax=Aliikangiella sp. G2MR2-5 TaxID=2788943 RepID=UPI0018AB9368|nr:serine/threonine-protein kinase [Aliikangiella sp. G2MR2-5]
MAIGISKSRWLEIQTALDDVLEQPQSEQLNYIEKYRDDMSLYLELKQLLDEDLSQLNLLEESALDLFNQESISVESNREKTGEPEKESALTLEEQSAIVTATQRFPNLGKKYQIVEEVGCGGMGKVYKARLLSDSFEKLVAIKILTTGKSSEHLVQRFEKEQKLLARLEHPNIARLLDGGISCDQTPFFVMEYIEGEPIDSYCDNNQLSIKSRLRLILQIVDALDYAHKNLVVHRDIKPSNILVTSEGKVRLVDFGIAKLIDEEKEQQLTQTGNQILTPGYAAPEQLLDQPITTATDTYLLGLVTYQLLTGRQAFQDLAGSLLEVAQIMCSEPPTKPSVINEKVGICENSKIFQSRQATPTQLKNTLQGDLDAIILKSLNAKVQDRYSSMTALRSDIEAYFENRPISAQQLTFVYQSKKYLKRHWKGVGSLVLFVAMLAAYTTTLKIQSEKIQAALAQSNLEKNKAQKISDFMLDIFKAADPNISGLNKITADELLQKGHQKILNELDSAPLIQAHMLTNLGEIYFSQGELDKSTKLLEEALEKQRLQSRPDSFTLAHTLTNLGVSYVNSNKLSEAQNLFDESLRLHQALLDDGENKLTIEYAEAHIALAQLKRKQGNTKESLQLYQKAIDTINQVGEEEHEQMAVALNGLASIQQDRGEFNAALENMKKAIRIHEKVLGSEHTYFTIYLNNLSILLISMERFDEALVHSKRAYQIQQNILPNNHPYFSAPLRSLGKISHARGELSKAREYFLEALDNNLKSSSKNNFIRAVLYARLGQVSQDLGALEIADDYYQKMLNVYQDVAAGERVVSRSLHLLAKLALLNGELSKARSYYQNAIESLPDNGIYFAISQLGYAQLILYLSAKQDDSIAKTTNFVSTKQALSEAQEMVTNAMTILMQKLPASHSLIAEAKLTNGLLNQHLSIRKQAEETRVPDKHNSKSIVETYKQLSKLSVYQYGHRRLLLDLAREIIEK